MANAQPWIVRHRASLGQFIRFGLVGGSGVLVNFAVYYAARRISPLFWPSAASIKNVFHHLPGTTLNLRWYMVFSMLAFIVANLWNYQLNRVWTFRVVGHGAVEQRPWWSGFGRFFAVGLLSQLVGMTVEFALLNHNSPFQLSPRVFDESTGLRNPGYWAHALMIIVTIPLSFLLNKFWTFRNQRKKAA
jgi:putative flippase GtrA